MVRQIPLIFLFIIISMMFTSCSDTYDNNDAYTYNPAWVTITVPSTNPYTIDKEVVHLTGGAFISDGWSRCCSGSASDTGVTVTWRNATTGTGALATQYVQYGTFLGTPYIKSHSWAADIPLAMGSNSISVTAYDPEYRDTDNITVIREADTTPPYVIYVRPNNQSSGVSVNPYISASFNESLNCNSVQADTLTLKDEFGVFATGTLSCSNQVIIFDLLQELAFDTLYTVTIKAGIKDLVDLNMTDDYQWSFTTSTPY